MNDDHEKYLDNKKVVHRDTVIIFLILVSALIVLVYFKHYGERAAHMRTGGCGGLKKYVKVTPGFRGNISVGFYCDRDIDCATGYCFNHICCYEGICCLMDTDCPEDMVCDVAYHKCIYRRIGIDIAPDNLLETNCTDGKDNDKDGFMDCEDEDCNGDDACNRELSIETLCDDGVDNDGDDAVDCYDDDCMVYEFCRSGIEVLCDDGKDNDMDGSIDCEDPDCAVMCSEKGVEVLCDDGEDNDEDGLIDCDDEDCRNSKSCINRVSVETLCDDGEDNDGDGLIDCDDIDCEVVCGEGEMEVICDDGEDNDGDGLIDCEDEDCTMEEMCNIMENQRSAEVPVV